MAEYQTVVDGFLNEPLTGRRPIETPETEINRANVLKVVMGKAEPIHLRPGPFPASSRSATEICGE